MPKPEKPIIPVLAAIIRNDKDEILIAKRRSNLSNGGLWEFPGGKLALGEKPENCLKREIREELGITIEVQKVYHIVNHSSSEKSILLMAYICKFFNGEIELIDHDETKWVTSEEILNYDLSKPDIPVAQKLVNKFSDHQI